MSDDVASLERRKVGKNYSGDIESGSKRLGHCSAPHSFHNFPFKNNKKV